MSVLMRLCGMALGLKPKSRLDADTAATVVEDRPDPAKPPKRLDRRWEVRATSAGGYPMTILTPRTGKTDVTVVYLHGGSYVKEMVPAHWRIIDDLARGTGANVVVPQYPLAPDHTVDEAFDLLTEILTDLRRRRPDDRIVLAGDSAGGGLALAYTLEHRADDLCASQLILFAPWVDVSMNNPEARTLEDGDVMLSVESLRHWGRKWAGSRPVTDVRVSPARGDLAGLPPTLVFQGGRDLFLSDVRNFAKAAKAVGSPVELRVAPDGFHVYVGFGLAPESRTAFDRVRTTIRGLGRNH